MLDVYDSVSSLSLRPVGLFYLPDCIEAKYFLSSRFLKHFRRQVCGLWKRIYVKTLILIGETILKVLGPI